MKAPTAAALIIGNEILTGKIADKNLSTLALRLRSLGVRLVRAHTILDDLDTIASEVRALAGAHPGVVSSGGVGPTHDDLTIEAIAKAFDRKVVASPEFEALLRRAYGDKITPGHLLMARVPEGAKLARTDDVPWPVVLCENVFVLPGVPEIFEIKMKIVESVVGHAPPFHSVHVFVSADEGPLKPFIDAAVSRYPEVEIGSYPQWTDHEWRTKITFDGLDRDMLAAAKAFFVATLVDIQVKPE
jgi:molybdenum cofactor synthesis domain-containing protein